MWIDSRFGIDSPIFMAQILIAHPLQLWVSHFNECLFIRTNIDIDDNFIGIFDWNQIQPTYRYRALAFDSNCLLRRFTISKFWLWIINGAEWNRINRFRYPAAQTPFPKCDWMEKWHYQNEMGESKWAIEGKMNERKKNRPEKRARMGKTWSYIYVLINRKWN